MVRTSGKGETIAGGFVLVPVASLMVAWRTSSVGDFRTWLACHEMTARRQRLDAGRSPAYRTSELSKLLGISDRRTRASVRRLVASGLIVWGLDGISFPPVELVPGEDLANSIGKGRGSVVVPRRIVRFLANGARPALIATALGILLRCLSRRRDGFDSWGRVKASWVARVFGLDERRIKPARRELVALGWIVEEPDRQSAMNRWGRAYRIALDWCPNPGRSLSPLDPVEGREIVTPSVDLDPLPEREENQEPASGRPAQTGVCGQAIQRQDDPKPPTLDDVQPLDLKETGRTLELFAQAAKKNLVGRSEADRLKFVALAEHARVVGKNPPALFVALLRRGAWAFITQAEEDVARRKLTNLLHPPKPVPPAASTRHEPSRLAILLAQLDARRG